MGLRGNGCIVMAVQGEAVTGKRMRKVGVKMLLCATMACACAPAVVAETTAAAMPETMAMLKHAIAAQTVAGQGQVLAFARYLAQKLEAGGFPASDIEVIPVGETAALVARYPGSTHEKPILLSAHMDVVPADASDWHYPPFHLTEANGHLYGRGTSDMKTNLVVLVETLLRFRREGFVPRRPLMLVFSGDEETAQATTSVLAKRYHDAEFVLNADGWGAVYDTAKHPVVFQVQAAEKSYADFALTVTSPGGHSSEPAPARNAIYRLARALDRVGAYGFPVRSDDITRQSLATLGAREGGALGKAMVDFSRDPGDAAAIAAISADPAYVGQIRTTCVATTWAGGHALNALPQRATANVNCRIFPGVTVAQVREYAGNC